MAGDPTGSGWLPPRASDDVGQTPERPAERPAWDRPAPADPPSGVGAGPREQPVGTGLPPSSRLAVTGTVLGSIGIFLLVMSLGVSLWLSALLGTAAILCSVMARKRIEAGIPGRPGQVRTARLVGLITLALSLVAGVVWLYLVSTGYTPADLQQDLAEWMAAESR